MTTPQPETVGLVARLGDALGTATRPFAVETELQRAVANVRAVFSAAACSCALAEPGGETLRFIAADGAGADAIIGVTLPIGRGIAGWVAMAGQPILLSDVTSDPRFARDVAESTDYVPETILAAPLVDSRGGVAGVLEVLDPHARGEHSGHDLAVLGLVATQLASIVRLAELYDALGRGLLRTLVDPDDEGRFDGAIDALADEGTGVNLSGLAAAFRELAVGGAAGARLAEQILRDVCTFTRAIS